MKVTWRGFPPGFSTALSTCGISSARRYPQISPQVDLAQVGERHFMRQTGDVNHFGANTSSIAIIIIR